MKLPDFLKSMELNSLRIRMGISADYLVSFSTPVSGPRLTESELNKLTSGEGIDVAFDELSVLRDGTLAYKGKRVLLYIRDVAHYGGRDSLPKYHLANCAVLQEARRSGRFGRRYVIANRADGVFHINMINGNSAATRGEHLNVCQVCLNTLKMAGFSFRLPERERKRRVKAFAPQDFFERYPIDLINDLPKFRAEEAPLNIYSEGFSEISNIFRAATNFHCQNCGIDLSSNTLKKFLHTHHLNADKSDNNLANLRALCIKCHAEQPGHAHMKGLPNYKEFLLLNPRRER